MSWPDDPLELLAGPRGRRLCFEAVSTVGGRDVNAETQWPGWFTVSVQRGLAGAARLAAELAAMIAVADLAGLAALADPKSLLEPLGAAVDEGVYWQPVDTVGRALRSPLLAEALAPVARAVSASPAAAWWSEPLARDQQRYTNAPVDSDPDADPGVRPRLPDLSGAAARLASWRADTLDDLRLAADRPADVTANYSGYWWSAPIRGPVSTTRSLPGLGSVQMCLIEDSYGPRTAWCWPLLIDPRARVLELRCPADWTGLVARYPLEVTNARRHDWWRVTGVDVPWLIPDYAAVAADYDALHLTVGGYLTTAGRALPVEVPQPENGSATGGPRTMLAGWDPDQTFWLADMVELAGPAVRWVTPDGDPFAWVPA